MKLWNTYEIGVYDYEFRFASRNVHTGVTVVSADPETDITDITDNELEALGTFVLTEMKRRGM